jgi:hypothetical protein
LKSLLSYLYEDAGITATPASTMGIGNPQVPGLSDAPCDVEGSTKGSGDLLQGRTAKCKKKKIISKDKD